MPGQPAVQPYLGRVGLVVTRRVPGSAGVEFCEWSPPTRGPIMAPKRVKSKSNPPLKQIEKDCSALLVELLRPGGARVLVVMPNLRVADHRRVAHSHEHHLPNLHAGIQRQRKKLAAVL